MRSKKFHGQAIFDLEKKHTSHSLKARDKGRKSPTKSEFFLSQPMDLIKNFTISSEVY